MSFFGSSLLIAAIKTYLPGILTNQDVTQTVLSISDTTSSGVAFTLNDLPEKVSQGVEQQIAIHKYVGGGLDVQLLGAFEKPITWSANFLYSDNSGNSAIQRAKTLEAMCVQGNTETIRIGKYSTNVVIKEFSYDYINDYYVPYSINLQPTGQLAIQSATSALATSSSASSSTTTTSNSTTTNITAAAAATTLEDILVAKGTSNSALAQTAIAAVASTQITHLVQSNETLYSIAKNYYGDSTLWTTIADANSITNPLSVTTGQKLIIPGQTS
jgi:LysM repeat protein